MIKGNKGARNISFTSNSHLCLWLGLSFPFLFLISCTLCVITLTTLRQSKEKTTEPLMLQNRQLGSHKHLEENKEYICFINKDLQTKLIRARRNKFPSLIWLSLILRELFLHPCRANQKSILYNQVLILYAMFANNSLFNSVITQSRFLIILMIINNNNFYFNKHWLLVSN